MNVLLVPAHPGFPGQIPQSRKTVVCVCVLSMCLLVYIDFSFGNFDSSTLIFTTRLIE